MNAERQRPTLRSEARSPNAPELCRTNPMTLSDIERFLNGMAENDLGGFAA